MGWGEAMNTNLLRVAFWVWLLEIGVLGLNFFVLMNQVYEPRSVIVWTSPKWSVVDPSGMM
jgi:hypothetical protein